MGRRNESLIKVRRDAKRTGHVGSRNIVETEDDKEGVEVSLLRECCCRIDIKERQTLKTRCVVELGFKFANATPNPIKEFWVDLGSLYTTDSSR